MEPGREQTAQNHAPPWPERLVRQFYKTVTPERCFCLSHWCQRGVSLKDNTEVPSRENFLSARPENSHSVDDIMDCFLLKNCWRVKHFKYNGNGSLVDFNGINLFVFREKVNKEFSQIDIGKVLGGNVFVIGPLGKDLPLSVIYVAWRITYWVHRPQRLVDLAESWTYGTS